MGSSDNGGASDAVTLGQSLEREGYAFAHVGIFDLNGTFRERRLLVDDVAQVYGNGGTFVNVLPQWDAGERVFGAGPFVGETVDVDAASVRPYPFEEGACALVADFTGTSADCSPRRLLARQIEKAREAGYGIRAAFEFEFFVLDDDAETVRESGFGDLNTFAKDNRCWAGESSAIYADFVRDLHATLTEGGVDMLALGMELGPGCFEATLRHGDPLRAADNAAFFKLFTKAFCRQRGMTASFMAQMGAAFPGLSGHIHLSLYDLKTGEDVFPDAKGDRGMSERFRSFVAGMVAMMPDGMPLTHTNANSYRRLAPGNWAPKSASWAVQNYSSAIRIVPEPASHCRLEYRLPGSDINPFLALSFVIGAGLWGMENGAALPAEFTGGGPDEMPADSASLPHDLYTATNRMAASETAHAIWGDRFVEHFTKACRAEEAALRRETSAAERARYLEVV